MAALLRRWLIAGLLVWLPIVATVLVLRLVVQILDFSLVLIPEPLQPEALFGFTIPGFGVVLSVVIVLATGAIVANFIGHRLVAFSERVVQRVPLVRSVYSGVKRLTETLMSDGNQTFRRVLLVEYPKSDVWTLAFQTGDPAHAVADSIGDVVTVYVPTTPNPTSGFVIFVPRSQVRVLDMPIEDALKMIMTLGVVTPERPDPKLPLDIPE